MHATLMAYILRGARAGATLAALAACAGETPTQPPTPYPYDLVVERREGMSGVPDIVHLDLEAQSERRVLGTGIAGMHPAGAPGGSQIAFVRTDAEFNSEIFTVMLDGTNLTNISNHAEIDVMPAWSRNGQRLAFVTDRAGFQDIFVVNVNGTNLRRATPEDPFPAAPTEQWPAWSPDGLLLAYSGSLEGTGDIWTVAVDVTPFELGLRTSGPDNDQHPTWSPTGDRIAFHRIDANTGEADIMILVVSTGVLQRISQPGQQLWPSWSPEGDLIAFSSNHEGNDFEVYTMRVDGSAVVRRTENGLNDLRPTWVVRPVGGG